MLAIERRRQLQVSKTLPTCRENQDDKDTGKTGIFFDRVSTFVEKNFIGTITA
jgi:hypothetical protein